jgi:hypothetical protein
VRVRRIVAFRALPPRFRDRRRRCPTQSQHTIVVSGSWERNK